MRCIGFFLIVSTLFGGAVSAEQTALTLTIKPSDVKLPAGVPLGQYRRVIQPFKNWTLICDENFKEKTRTCNVTQSIVDQTGRTVFSWSVAATEQGKPFMILRTLPGLGTKREITLDIPDGRTSVRIPVAGCNAAVCVGTVPIGPRLRPQVTKGGVIGISYTTAMGEKIKISAPLVGINDALAAIE